MQSLEKMTRCRRFGHSVIRGIQTASDFILNASAETDYTRKPESSSQIRGPDQAH